MARRRRPLLRAALLVVALGAAYFGYLNLSGNVHEVVAGELYRSAQLDAGDIRELVREHDIRTIVNLRGQNQGTPWYDEEITAAHDLQVVHVDFAMSASRRLSREEVDELTRILADAPKPILIHCMGGADRSGLASAIYLAEVRHEDIELAEEQIALRFGHVAIPYLSSAFAMDENWEEIEAWAGHDESDEDIWTEVSEVLGLGL